MANYCIIWLDRMRQTCFFFLLFLCYKEFKKLKVLKIKINVTQIGCKVWISRKNIILAQFGTMPKQFVHEPKKM